MRRATSSGFSNPPGDAGGIFIAHAFIWTKSRGIRDLKTLPEMPASQALGINSRGQVVGFSTSATGVNRAFLWQEGKLMKLERSARAGFSPTVWFPLRTSTRRDRSLEGSSRESSGKTLAFVATPIQ